MMMIERGEVATDRVDSGGNVDQGAPMCMNRDVGSFRVSQSWYQVISRSRAPSSCKPSKRDQKFNMSDGHRNVVVR